MSEDARWMAAALALGARGQGRAWPNPAVGCLLVKDGRLIARGWTQPGGRPHAEIEALDRARGDAAGATAYVTLEPCANWGRTPPCAGALVEAGVRRVVVGCLDPDPRVDGKGLAWLKAAGIEVRLGVLEAEARAAHLGLYRRIIDKRPMVSLKLAQSADGRIATGSGHSQWITGEQARAEAHRLRAVHDAILVGSGTVLADNPLLTCRLDGLEDRSPVRVVLDRRLRTPPASHLVRSASDVPVWIVTAAAADARSRAALEAAGAEVVALADSSLLSTLGELARRGIGRLMVEGGAGLAGSLIRVGLVDRLHLCTAPILIGGDGLASIGGFGLDRVDAAPRFKLVDVKRLGDDTLHVLAADA